MKRGSRVGELEREKAGPRSTQMSPYPPILSPHGEEEEEEEDR